MFKSRFMGRSLFGSTCENCPKCQASDVFRQIAEGLHYIHMRRFPQWCLLPSQCLISWLVSMIHILLSADHVIMIHHDSSHKGNSKHHHAIQWSNHPLSPFHPPSDVSLSFEGYRTSWLETWECFGGGSVLGRSQCHSSGGADDRYCWWFRNPAIITWDAKTNCS